MAVSSITLQMIGLDQCSKPVVNNRSLVASFKVGKHHLQVVCNGTKVYFYKEKKRMVIYELPGILLCWCTALINQKKTLLCGLEDGRVCAINLKDIVKHKKRKPVDTLVKSESTEDIFAELLDNEMAPSEEETHTSTRENVLVLDEKSVVLEINNLVKLVMTGSYLLTASTAEDMIVISVFQQTIMPDHHEGMKSSPRLYFEKSQGCERIFKCQRSASFDAHTNMYCVVSETIATAGQFQEVVVINDELFNEIFGAEYNMMGSCMILIGLPDGTIITVPFKDVSNFTKTHLPTRRVLYNLHQPLAFICAMQLDQIQHVGDTLMLLGTEGKLLTIALKNGENSRVAFNECYIQEPVQAVVKLSSSMLLYSTGKELLQLQFNTQKLDHELLDNFSSNDLGVNQVVALSDVYPNRGQQDSILGNVFVLTSRGKIGNVQIPEGIMKATHPCSPDSTGKRIQELLTAINSMATEMKNMKDKSVLHNAILLELNKACHLTSELSSHRTKVKLNKECRQTNELSSHRTKLKHSSLLCTANLEVDAQGTSKELSLICSVTNQSLFTMSIGWSFHVTITGGHDWFSQTNVISKSIPLSAFHPGEKRRLRVNVTEGNISLPIDVSLAVLFDASNLLANLDRKETQMSKVILHNGSVSIPITSIHFDLLDVLHPVNSQVAGNTLDTTHVFQTKPGSHKASAEMAGWMKKSKLAFTESENLSIILRFKTFNICQIISLEDGLNYDKLFRWLLPAATKHLPTGVLTGQVSMRTISPDGCEVIFSLSIIAEETSITLQSEQMRVLCQVVMAIHLKMQICLQMIGNKGLLLDEIQQRITNLKVMCDEIEDFKCRIPSSSLQEVQERMQIYVNARSQRI